MSREEQVAAFARAHGFGAARAAPLAQDASLRRYLRLSGGPRPALVMDAAPKELPPFLGVARHLAALGLSVPEIIAADEPAGLLLLEDFGDALFHTLPPATSAEAWDAAVDALLAMQSTPPPPGLPSFDADAMRTLAVATVLDWWWPTAFGAPAPDEARLHFNQALVETLAPLDEGPLVFVHRDYFAGNLIWLPDRDGARRAGVIDFQLGSQGPAAYDLASLTHDSRRETPEALVRRAIDRAGVDSAHIAICAAQRNMRMVGQWTRLAMRDGKPQYLAYAPHTWRLLEAALTHPANRALADAFERWIPAGVRPR